MGINNAEFIFDPDTNGRALGTWGKFGTIGKAIQLPAYAQRQVLSIIHELGHHLWALNEEYARAISGTIDKVIALPAGHGNLIIPLVSADLGIADAEFSGANALLIFDGNVETRTIDYKSGDQIIVISAFSQNPQNTNWSRVTVQWVNEVECTGNRSTGACIMEFSRSSAGELEDDGTWTPAINPVTEFCTAFNHDPDQDTGQHNTYAASCWETIISHSSYTDLATGAPSNGTDASQVAPTGFVVPNWVELTEDFRFALVLDRSGSMNRNGGARLEGTKTGAAYWLENAAVEGDHLAIIWFNTSDDISLNLTDFAILTDTQVNTLVDDVLVQTATGGTNIRDGLHTALNEIVSPGTLGALNASLLLTDGAHNTPYGSSMQEAVPDYQDNNASIYTLGIGTGAEMDLDGLEELSNNTGGSSFTVGDGTNAMAIQTSMIEINNLIRGGLLTAGPDTLADMREEDTLSKLKLNPNLPPEKRPQLHQLAKEVGLKSWEELKGIKGNSSGRLSVFILTIEEGAQASTFTLSFGKQEKLWMYLIDPDGNEVPASSPEVVVYKASGQPYEFAKINKPKSGKWKIIAFRPSHGAAVTAKAIVGIQHQYLNVYATAKNLKCGIHLTAGARYLELLTGIYVNAIFSNEKGKLFQIALKDNDETGDYDATVLLPNGHYEGYIEIHSPGNTMIANYRHVILHAESLKKTPNLLVKHPAFIRHIPISFIIGDRKDPKIDKDELNRIYQERNQKPNCSIGYSKTKK